MNLPQSSEKSKQPMGVTQMGELKKINHRISVRDAKILIKRFRTNKRSLLNPETTNENTLPNCETFWAQPVKELLSQMGVVAFRIYLGMDKEKSVCMVLVGVDKFGKDITRTKISLSSIDEANAMTMAAVSEQEAVILEDGQRCPKNCPETSDLNEG